MKKKKEWLDLQLFAQEAQTETQAETAAPREEAAPQEQQEEPKETLYHRFHGHLQELHRQAAALQRDFPGLDLNAELRNPVFSRLTSPTVGLSVEDAYYAVHRRELQSAAMEAAARQVSNTIASGARRPRENGLSGQAPAVSSFDYASASAEQRENLKKQIRQAAAEGRKIYPGRGL